MKSKYYLALILTGILPVLALTGLYFWLLFNQPQAPRSVGVNTPAVQAAIPLLKTQVETMASSMSNAIQKTNNDIPTLYAHNTDTDLENFVKTHPGVSGVAVLSMNGRVERLVPSSPPLITDPSYGSSEEFQKTAEKLKENGGKPYLFYTQKMGYPAFVFAVPVAPQSIAEALLSLSNFFRNIDANSGDIFLLEAGSGTYFYHTNPAKIGTLFNPNQEGWLSKIQADLANNQGGSAFNPDRTSAVYASLGFGKFGIVHTFPSSILQPASPAVPASSPKISLDNWQELVQTPMSLGLVICMGWIFIVGSLFFGFILSPLRKASTMVLNAAQGKGALTAETARRFGKDEIGQMVSAAALLLDKLQKDKQAAEEEKEEALRKGKAEVDSKTREAANQVSTAQQQAQAARGELADKNQQMNDKLKELDALKAMSEGLRNQTEQAKAEIAKWKSEAASSDQAKAETQKKLTETQGQLDSQFKQMESKLLMAMGSSSAIQISQVRVAAIRTMAEELKTTLGIIKGYVSSALGTTQGGINEKQQEFLGMVINRSARLEKFINDLVDIYQVEIEQADAKYEQMNLPSEIEGLAFNFQAQAEVKNIKMKVEAKPGIPLVPIVRRRFNQLWNILYLQIIKDAPRGSSIPITVESLGEIVKVTVQDPGLVVAPESLPRLFDEFYDPKHPASPQLAGTGLKFALVKTILASHGGGAVAEKAEPGTKLILTFPTKIKKPGEAPAPAAAPRPAAPSMGAMGASPSVTAAGIKPLMPPGGIGAPKPPSAPGNPMGGIPKPPAPGMAPGIPRPAPPGMPPTGMTPPPGMPKPPGAPGSPAPPAGGGMLDSLISKIPPVSAPGVKPPGPPGMPAPPPMGSAGAPAPPRPPLPGMPAPAVPKPPSLGTSGMPASPVPGVPAASKPPTPTGGFLDALLDKKPATPGASSGPAAAPPRPAMPPAGAPGTASPAAPRPLMPPAGGPGAPSMGTAPPVPGAPPAAPKVIPTAMKPAPAPGVLDLDSADGMKLDAGTKPPPVPPTSAPRPPMPGSPMPPPGAPKPPMPGMPPGGLSTTPPPKKDEGELLE